MSYNSYQVRKLFDFDCVKCHWEKYWVVFQNGKVVTGFPWLENFNDVRSEILRRRGWTKNNAYQPCKNSI